MAPTVAQGAADVGGGNHLYYNTIICMTVVMCVAKHICVLIQNTNVF